MNEEKGNQAKAGKPNKPKGKDEYRLEYDNYSVFLHKKRVEVHVAYEGTVLKIEGIIRAKAKFDIQLLINDKEYITINKAYIILIKPLE